MITSYSSNDFWFGQVLFSVRQNNVFKQLKIVSLNITEHVKQPSYKKHLVNFEEHVKYCNCQIKLFKTVAITGTY